MAPRAVDITVRVADMPEVKELLRQSFNALDTAQGCLDLVAEDRKPIDLEECRDEIGHARMALYKVLGYDNG